MSLEPYNDLPLFEVVAYRETPESHLEIGVLKDGTPFMTGRSLARAAGIAYSTISELGRDWNKLSPETSARNQKLSELLNAHGFGGNTLSVPTFINGTASSAYTGAVCMAILEYYAFHAGVNQKQDALDSFRYLAQRGFQNFVYEATGYSGDSSLAAYFERVSLNNVIPTGFFSIFKEADELIVALINHGLPADPSTIPDISIGQAWASHWKTGGFDATHGERRRYLHRYPSNYPQSMAATDAWIYPDSVLPEYRRWIREVYIPTKLKPYLDGKVKKQQMSAEVVAKIVSAVRPLVQPGPARPELGPGAA